MIGFLFLCIVTRELYTSYLSKKIECLKPTSGLLLSVADELQNAMYNK